ncbi:tetratricopeptide repeat protein [Sorangium cellulosum]|nr:hypothetical protein [Sorangium cellulosum]
MFWFDEALADIERALELRRDDAYSEAYRSIIYSMMRRTEEALAGLFRVTARDARLVITWSIEIGLFLVYSQRYGEAISWLERGLSRGDSYYAHYFTAVAKALRDGVHGARGEIESARAAARATLETEGRAAGEYMLAGMDVLEGRRDEAVARLESAMNAHDSFIEISLYDPVARSVCGHPRLRSVILSRISEEHRAMKYFRGDIPTSWNEAEAGRFR